MNKIKFTGALLTLSSMVAFLTPAYASAATSACNNYFGAGTRVASATWGCVAAKRQGTTIKTVTFDVDNDGKCVKEYFREFAPNKPNFEWFNDNCSGGFLQQNISNAAGTTDIRIYRSDFAYFNTIYDI